MSSVASRRANDSRVRRLTKVTLAVDVILGVLLAAASLWVSWLGIVGIAVALAAGAVAVGLAWREHREYRVQANEEARQAARAQTEQLRQVRADHSEVMGVLTHRNETLRGELREARAEVGELSVQVSRLRGDNAALRVENDGLRREVAGLRGLDASADVVALPRRRVLAESRDRSEADAETVVNLDLARLTTPFVEDAVRRHAN